MRRMHSRYKLAYACPRCSGSPKYGAHTSGVGCSFALPSAPIALSRTRPRLPRSAVVQPEGSGAYPLFGVCWCVVCPDLESRGCLCRSAYVVAVCTTTHRGSDIPAVPREAVVGFTTPHG